MKSPFRTIVFSFLVFVLLGSGCKHVESPPGPKAETKPTVTPTGKSEGYALLYDLVSKEKDVSKLLIIKKETDQLGVMIKKISTTARQMAEELEGLSKQNPPLNLKHTGLPGMEQRTRELIDSETGKTLLHSKDVQLEFRLLLTQVEAMNYGTFLARALLEVESNFARRRFLEQAAKKFSTLHDEVFQMILNRYAR